MADSYPPLSATDELKMMRSKISMHEKRLTLWRHNLRYAALLAAAAWNRRTPNQILTSDELRSTAALALWEATATFDVDRSARFISYSKWVINRALNDHLVQSQSGFSVPRAAIRILKELRQEEKTGNKSTVVSRGRIASARTYRSSISSMDTAIVLESGALSSKHSLIAGDSDIHKEVEAPELRASINDLIQKLERFDERLPKMMRDYYGIGRRDRLNLQQIADLHGLTRQRIEQLLSRALRRLRAIVAAKGLKLQDLLAA